MFALGEARPLTASAHAPPAGLPRIAHLKSDLPATRNRPQNGDATLISISNCTTLRFGLRIVQVIDIHFGHWRVRRQKTPVVRLPE
jgi:hypothetical protein